MLSPQEVQKYIQDDFNSDKKRDARKGQRYYEGDHDIRDYKLYYCNEDGKWIEDKTRSNIKISHPFFTELVDQAAQYILSGGSFVKSKDPELQAYLDAYFNNNDDFVSELSETLSGAMSKGSEYMFAYKRANGKTGFKNADSIGVVEVRAKDTDDNTENIIYWYTDRVEKSHEMIKRIQVWDDKQVMYYVQKDNDSVMIDTSETINPQPHIVKIDREGNRYDGGSYGSIPFFRLDNCKKQFSDLKAVKALIDDYDLMACGLSNNIQDASEYVVVVKGFQGNNLEELINNTKTKKHVGVDEGGDLDFKTVAIPYEARKVKLELDEKNIYRFGFGLNTAGLKDTAATTNIAIKAAYSLLDMKAKKLEIRLKQMLRKIVELVINEINTENDTDYQTEDVYFEFTHEVMSNVSENATINLTEAQAEQAKISTLISLATYLDNETFMRAICDVLEVDYEEIKDKLPDQDEAAKQIKNAEDDISEVAIE